MHNIRKIKRKRKMKVLNSQQAPETPQDKLIQISRFQNQQEDMSDADLFAQKLKPKQFPLEAKPVPKGRILQHQYHMTQFVNNFQRKRKIQPKYISFSEDVRCHSSSLPEKKPISIIQYMLIDKREQKEKTDLRSKFSSITQIKRKFSPRKNKSQQSQGFSEKSLLGGSNKNREGLVKLLKENSSQNATPFTIKNVKVFTKYSNFFAK